jgi:hypothetical protein
MLALIRKHQYALFLIVLIVGIAFFVFPDSQSAANANRFGGPDGRPMNVLGTKFDPTELDSIKDSWDILYRLGTGSEGGFNFNDPMFQHLMRINAIAQRTQGTTQEEQDQRRDFVVNTALVRVLARQAGINASETEINERIQSLPRFQTEGKFDPSKWSVFLNAFGGEAGASRKAIYTTIGDSILFDKLVALAGPVVPRTQVDLDLAYANENQRITASVVALAKKDFENPEISEQDLKDYYEKNKDSDELKSDEKRSFSYVVFPAPTPEQLKDLDEGAKTTKQREHKKLAMEFANQLVAEDRGAKTFDEIAAGLKLEVKKAVAVTLDTLPDDLKGKGQVPTTLFSIVETGRSEVEAGPDGYYGFEVTAIEPPQPLSFEDAKEKMTASLKTQKQKDNFDAFVKTTREKLQASLAAGKSLAEAATEAGVTTAPRELPAFSQKKPLAGETDARAIALAATKIDVGQLSEPVPTADGVLLVYAAKKELPQDPKMEDDKKAIALRQAMMTSQSPEANPLFSAWFNKKRDQADATLSVR